MWLQYHYEQFLFFYKVACLTLIYGVHFLSRKLSLHDPLWVPTRHPTTTYVHWPMPFTEELCWQLVSPCRRVHMKQQPELQPERAEAAVYDPDAQTGLDCPAWHQSLPAPLPLAWPQPCSTRSVPKRGRLRRPARKHAYKSPVCIAPEVGSVPTHRSSREWALGDEQLSWGCCNLSVTAGASVGLSYKSFVHVYCTIVIDFNTQLFMNLW